MKTIAVMACGGSGSRMNAGMNKILLPLAGKTVIRHSLEAFSGLIDEMILCIRPEDESRLRQEADLAAVSYPVRMVSGGATRQESVLNGLKSVSWDADDIVLVHDAARCLVEPDLIRRVIDSCIRSGSGVPAIPAVSTFKLCDENGFVVRTIPRASLYEIQTPQGFIGSDLLRASIGAAEQRLEVTDDASVMEQAGCAVRTVPGSVRNLKLTTPEDYMAAEHMLNQNLPALRVGTGYDVHRLTEDRKLILCGVEIPWELGLLGHSDADVALHALMDAMLGAAALGDIGKHFPDTDPRYKGISSLLMLKKTAELLQRSGYRTVNVDITIVAQKPKLLPYIPRMRQNVADALSCALETVSVKATTTEKLGFEGRLEGISAQAVCLVQAVSNA